jgi:hypothetical protein
MAQTDRLTSSAQLNAVKTWRYLRLAMIVVVVGLGVAIAFEHFKTDPRCFQTSISAYYYTPAGAVFVAALVTIGACLISLKGNTDWEDILLNLAGMFAPIVAFVPTPGTGSCGSVLGTTKDRNVNVANNIFTLIVVGALGLLVLGALMIRAQRSADLARQPNRSAKIGYAVAFVAWLGATLVFGLARHFFVANAHYTAAGLLFVCIVLVVVIDAVEFKAKTAPASRWNRYLAIAVAMVLSVVIMVIAKVAGWDYWLLGLEISLIALFAAFWAIQTAELWDEGLRQGGGQPAN